jgi:hypothetical protein
VISIVKPEIFRLNVAVRLTVRTSGPPTVAVGAYTNRRLLTVLAPQIHLCGIARCDGVESVDPYPADRCSAG